MSSGTPTNPETTERAVIRAGIGAETWTLAAMKARTALDALLTERDAAVKERDELLAAPASTLGRLRERVETENWSGPLADELAAAEATLTRYRNTLERIEANAEAWHHNDEAMSRALLVIASEARAALDGPKE